MKVVLILATTSVVAASDSPCSSCLVDNADSFSGKSKANPKAWCYSTSKCIDLSWDNALPWVNLFNSCPDYTFEADTCVCRPDIYKSCGDCATVSHLGCVWVANASVTNNFSYAIRGQQLGPTMNFSHYWKEGRCMRGMGFSPLGLEEVQQFGNSSSFLSVKYTKTTRPMDWYWAQCSLTGPKMAGLMVGLLGLLCCACCLCGCCCYAKKKRRNQEFLVTNNGLLQVAGR